ncbi:MAG: hypothetical protein M0Z36_05820 [Thermaerobacter sp.]|nr:hypothetical protein [Thermaerobacter sp.]
METEELGDEELAVVTAVIALLCEQQALTRSRVREVWPNPSPWRWAAVTGGARQTPEISLQ